MPDLQFATLDVFTSKRMKGNPLAVVQVPATLRTVLSQAAKQSIAREFNLSETVFLHEAEAGEEASRSRAIDIFLVDREVPFAGHPTVGAAVFARHHLGLPHVDTLVLRAGAVGLGPGDGDGDGVRARIPHAVHLHAQTLGDVFGANPDNGAATPGLSPVRAIREAELAAPVFSVVRGMTFVLVRLASLEQLAQVSAAHRLDFEALRRPLLDEGPWRESFVCRYYYVDVGEETEDREDGGEKSGRRCVRARMVEPGFEDPATGSAATALGSYLTLNEEKKGRRFRVTQGVEMGRTSNIEVETTTREAAGGGVELEDLWLGGTAVVVMKGSLTVDL
ncbi:Diaminopimelate epimerase-like protein [Hypoxylon sp. NC1633]|nr:Diaminopimelate epimerase-like protein [Hypoxylon sp. NC1633]